LNWFLLRNSLLVGGFTTLLAVGFGLMAALWLAALPSRWRNCFLVVGIVALALPPFVVTNCWLSLLGHTGVWRSWLPLDIFSLGGTVWILSLLLWPIPLLAILSAWRRLEPAQLESDMAVTGWALMRCLLFPLARATLAQAAVLVFVLALNNFAVPAILQVKVFPAEMWVRFTTTFDTLGTLKLSWPLIAGPLLLLLWFARREIPWPHLESPVSARLFRQQLGRVWFVSCGAGTILLCLLAVGLPLVQLVSAHRTWVEFPGALAAGHAAIFNSLEYAAISATAIVVLALALATCRTCGSRVSATRGNELIPFVAGRSLPPHPNPLPQGEGESQPVSLETQPCGQADARPPAPPLPKEEGRGEGKGDVHPPRTVRFTAQTIARRFGFGLRTSDLGLRISDLPAWLLFLTPGVLLGILLITLFNHGWSSLLYQSAGIVILAFAIRYFALGWTTVAHAAQTTDRDLADVARLEGATRWQTLRHVLWPQIAPQAAAAWYIVFLLCLWDVESMILVVPPGGETLSLRIFNLLHYGHNSQVDALCLMLLVVALTPLILWKLPAVLGGHGGAVSLITATALLLFCGCAPHLPANESPLQSRLFTRVQIFGSRGVGVGQLNKPRSVAVDAQDNFYVVDMTGRVQKFSPQGTFLLLWQMPQTELGKPKGMCRDRDGDIIVVEPHYSRINHFSTDGKLVAQWGDRGTNIGQFFLPRAIGVNSRGEFFVSEYQEAERVQKFALESPINTPLKRGGTNGATNQKRFSGFSASNQTAEAVGSALDHPSTPLKRGANEMPAPSNSPLRSAVRARFLGGFGKPGTGPGEFNRPEGLCIDAQDRVYVADSCNHRIQVFSSDGKFLRAYGKPGTGKGELSYPYDICVDAAGRQYVCEFGNSRIQVFDDNDQCIEIIGGPGTAPGQFSNPWGVALDSHGNLYVADSQNHRVQKLIREPRAESREPKAS
jgi:ABC-type Fe3+ transport system permease subunit/DNA-binding beta-propeller fold protein YncE